MMLFAAVNNYQTGTLSGFEEFRVLAILNLIRGSAAFPMIVCGVIWGGLPGAVSAYSLASLFTFIIYEVAIRRCSQSHGTPISYRFECGDIRLLWSYSVPVLLASLSFTPAAWWSATMLARGSGYAEVGLFNAAFQWQTVMMFLANAVSNLGLPMLSAALPERAIAAYKRLLGVNFALTFGLTLMVAMPTALGARWIMSIYGHQFHGGAAVLRLVCLATVLSAMNITVGQAIWSLDAAVSGMVLGMLRGLALLTGAYYFSGKGATGLAGAYVFMGAVQTVVQAPFMFWLLRRHALRWASVGAAPELPHTSPR
jgi:O-antigen/teichoic acid export membrane protein